MKRLIDNEEKLFYLIPVRIIRTLIQDLTLKMEKLAMWHYYRRKNDRHMPLKHNNSEKKMLE